MSVTVAAALKKVAAAVLTDKKAGKTVGGVVLAVILIVIFPIVGVTGALGSLGEVDAAQLQAILAENLSGSEIEKLQTFEDTMRASHLRRERRRRYMRCCFQMTQTTAA